ncbi:MAG TPA: hypothetical protein VND95_00505 [Stellaceae bacterium]|nr:hypothetical protein [Stellaceae bacterium]
MIGAIVLSPIVLIFALPMAVGIGLDVFSRAGEAPVALALCLPLAVLLLRRAWPRASLRQAVAALAPARVRPRRPARPR